MSQKVDNSLKCGEYTVHEMTLRQMRTIQGKEIDKEDMQYHIACLCVTKPDGTNISMDELNDLPVRKATKLLQVVAKLNTSQDTDAEGND